MEPEVCISNRIVEQITLVSGKYKIDNGLQKELKEYETKDAIPFRLVKKIHDVLSESGDFRSFTLCDQCNMRTEFIM